MILSYLVILEQVLFLIKQINLSVNSLKTDFVKTKVVYLWHLVGHGVVTPVKVKVKSIIDYPIPENKFKSFFGMAGYYKQFCKKYSEVTATLTELLKRL